MRASLVVAALLSLSGCSLLDPRATGPPPRRPTGPPVAVSGLPRAGGVAATVPVMRSPNGMVYDGRYLWVGSDLGNEVVQVDPVAGRVVRTVTVGASPLTLAVVDGTLWVADFGSATVHCLDPRSGRVTGTAQVGRGPIGFAEAGGGLWVINKMDRSATLIDAGTMRAVRTVGVSGLGAGFPAGGAGYVWAPDLTGPTGAVWRLDPATGAVRSRVPVGALPSEVAFGFGSAWVTTIDALVRLDPRTGRVQARITGLGRNLDGLAITADAVWVGSIPQGTVSRVDPRTNRATAAMTACGTVRHLVAVAGEVWAACAADGTVIRIRPA